jgi:hypothetical protein
MKFPARSILVLLAVCLALGIPGAVSASQQTLVLVSGTNTQSAGYTIVLPANPLSPASYGGSWYNAVASTDIASTWYHADQAPFGSGAVWVSSAAVREGSSGQDQWRLFQQNFDLPAGATIDSAQLAYTADNAVTVYLNGVQVGTTGSVNVINPADNYFYKTPFTAGLAPVTGTNTLSFVVRNFKNGASSFNPSSLLYKADIVYTVNDIPAPEFPSAFVPVTMIIGILGTVLFVRKTRES